MCVCGGGGGGGEGGMGGVRACKSTLRECLFWKFYNISFIDTYKIIPDTFRTYVRVFFFFLFVFCCCCCCCFFFCLFVFFFFVD